MKKGFTLVELIVVITILTILWTLAFVSLQGYSQEAKRSKVLYDIRTLISAIESSSTQNPDFSVRSIIDNSEVYWNKVLSWSFNNWVSINSSEYNLWKVNFPFLKQSKTDFIDPEWNNYIAASIFNTSTPEQQYYQIVWQTKNSAWTYDPIIKWTYVKISISDINGLVAWAWYPNWVSDLTNWMISPGLY